MQINQWRIAKKRLKKVKGKGKKQKEGGKERVWKDHVSTTPEYRRPAQSTE